jgi:hypothetical protein
VLGVDVSAGRLGGGGRGGVARRSWMSATMAVRPSGHGDSPLTQRAPTAQWLGLATKDIVNAVTIAVAATHAHHSPTSRTCQLLVAL